MPILQHLAIRSSGITDLTGCHIIIACSLFLDRIIMNHTQYMYICIDLYLSIYLSNYLSIHRSSIYISFCLSIYLSIYCSFIHLSIYLFRFYLSFYLYIFLSFFLDLYLSIYLFFYAGLRGDLPWRGGVEGGGCWRDRRHQEVCHGMLLIYIYSYPFTCLIIWLYLSIQLLYQSMCIVFYCRFICHFIFHFKSCRLYICICTYNIFSNFLCLLPYIYPYRSIYLFSPTSGVFRAGGGGDCDVILHSIFSCTLCATIIFNNLSLLIWKMFKEDADWDAKGWGCKHF